MLYCPFQRGRLLADGSRRRCRRVLAPKPGFEFQKSDPMTRTLVRAFPVSVRDSIAPMDDLLDKRIFRVPVKLVNAVDQSELPIEGFVLIPERRLQQFETVARSARSLLDAAGKASTDVN